MRALMRRRVVGTGPGANPPGSGYRRWGFAISAGAIFSCIICRAEAGMPDCRVGDPEARTGAHPWALRSRTRTRRRQGRRERRTQHQYNQSGGAAAGAGGFLSTGWIGGLPGKVGGLYGYLEAAFRRYCGLAKCRGAFIVSYKIVRGAMLSRVLSA